MRDVGGVLPTWVEPTSEDESACILDIVILHDPGPITAPEARRLRTISCMWRVVTGAPQILASNAVWSNLPRTDVAVSAAAPDLDTVARCFADLVVEGGMIGVDSIDLFNAIGCQGSQVVCGRAVIVQGQGRKAGLAARHELTLMQSEGTISAVFLCQLVSASDTLAFALNEVDEMATAAMAERDRDLALTCYLDRPRTEVVVIAFDRRGSDCSKCNL